MLQVRGSFAGGGCLGPALTRRLSAGRRVCRKYRKVYIRRLQQQEYDRLRSMVPSLAAATDTDAPTDKHRKKKKKNRISKIKVIEATIQYIDQLHQALAERLHPDGVEAKTKDDEVATVAKGLFVVDAKTRASPSGGAMSSHSSVAVVCEKERRIPSYLLQSEVLS